MTQRCQGTTKLGAACAARQVGKSGYCLAHDPDPAAKAAALNHRRRGGLARRRRAPPPSNPNAPVSTLPEVFQVLREELAAARALDIGTPRFQAVGGIIGHVLSAIRLAKDLNAENQIAELRELLREAREMRQQPATVRVLPATTKASTNE